MEHLAALAIAIGSWLTLSGGSWRPSAQDVAEARAQLEPYVARQARLEGEALPPWNTYRFQYRGQELNGKKVIFVNAFCSAPPDLVVTEVVEAYDGGPCYFRAYWDPAEKIYLSVLFNGHA
ncbi:hypothetical protein JI752_009585 [Lysobacter sp. MMG2]|uniref:hypothetical protein n=1 Tax=Lysobacter sp. MMG2 TaxID=2801338 RepID=UPI001C23EDDC|nr:hypothetical protein [Lysobacter sp. MMG2]MBU8976388.1 hypothetical protein [Lysobacter sp. MMG2]